MSYVKTEFALAKPVWEPGRENERNRSLIVSAVLDGADEAELRLTGSSVYRVFVNRRLAYWGPARSGKGFFRVDEIPLGVFLHEGENIVAVEVTGYCCSSFEWMKHSSFLCAELIRGGAVLAATGAYGWQVFRDGRRLQKTPRFSFQRPFSEAYDHRAGRVEPTGWAVVPGGEWIERDLPGCEQHPIHHDALRIGADGRWCIIRAYYFHVFSCFSYAKLPQVDSTSKRILSRLPNSFFYLLITYLQ